MPEKQLVISDFDNVFYRYPESLYMDMKSAFAAAACSLNPDLNFEQALDISIKSWDMHRDAVTAFVEDHGINRDQMHGYAHRIVRTKHWSPIDGLSDMIAKLQSQGDFIIWTHGTRQLVLNNLDRLGLYGQIKDCDIYDMIDMGRKDTDVDAYYKICEERGVIPQNTMLIEDTALNLQMAKKAGLQTAHVDWESSGSMTKAFIDISEANTIKTYNKVLDRMLKSQMHLVA